MSFWTPWFPRPSVGDFELAPIVLLDCPRQDYLPVVHSGDSHEPTSHWLSFQSHIPSFLDGVLASNPKLLAPKAVCQACFQSTVQSPPSLTVASFSSGAMLATRVTLLGYKMSPPFGHGGAHL
jgi:hypothetical protein